MEIVDSNPFKKVKPIKTKPVREKEPFSAEETAQILTTCREQFAWFYPLVLVASVTGSRRLAVRGSAYWRQRASSIAASTT